MSKASIDFYDFPKDLSKKIKEIWTEVIIGDYTYPLLPSEAQLQLLLEVVYLSSLETDELRALKFSLCCFPISYEFPNREIYELWEFSEDRPFSIQEVKRLAVTADLDTTMIWVCFGENSDAPLIIRGLIHLGSSWAEARRGYSYCYNELPHALIVRIESAGKLAVYQGKYCIMELKNGRIYSSNFIPTGDLLGVYPFFSNIQNFLRESITPPKYEEPSEWHPFEWSAIVNTVLSIVNTIQLNGHGGALILSPSNNDLCKNLKIKYKFDTDLTLLKDRFVEFMNIRHKYGDMLWPSQFKKDGLKVSEEEIKVMGFMLEDTERALCETCKFIGNLSATDGAVVLNDEFKIIGFGSEILLDKAKPSTIYRVLDPLKNELIEGDSEEFGMRHRSAMRLCGSNPSLSVFVISQDGGISLIWNNEGKVCYLQGMKTTNANMVLA